MKKQTLVILALMSMPAAFAQSETAAKSEMDSMSSWEKFKKNSSMLWYGEYYRPNLEKIDNNKATALYNSITLRNQVTDTARVFLNPRFEILQESKQADETEKNQYQIVDPRLGVQNITTTASGTTIVDMVRATVHVKDIDQAGTLRLYRQGSFKLSNLLTLSVGAAVNKTFYTASKDGAHSEYAVDGDVTLNLKLTDKTAVYVFGLGNASHVQKKDLNHVKAGKDEVALGLRHTLNNKLTLGTELYNVGATAFNAENTGLRLMATANVF